MKRMTEFKMYSILFGMFILGFVVYMDMRRDIQTLAQYSLSLHESLKIHKDWIVLLQKEQNK